MEGYESNPRSRSMATRSRLWRQQRLKIIRLLLSVQERRYNERVGGPANAIQGGCRRQCTNCGWPVGPTLKRMNAWGDRPMPFKEAAEGSVPTAAGRWARR